MAWVSKQVQARFIAFLRAVNNFRENYATQENQFRFEIIAKICENIATLFAASEPPNEADTRMSTLSSGIQTQLPRLVDNILSSNMRENDVVPIKVLERMGTVITELNRLVSACEKDLLKLHKMLLSPRESQSDFVETSETNSLSVEIQVTLQLLRVVPVRELTRKSRTYSESESGAAPTEDSPLLERSAIRTSSSCMSFFNRAFQTCTKTMVSGVSVGTLGLGYLGLTYLSKYLGDDLDNLMHADQIGLDHKLVITVLLMLSSTALCGVALVKSRYHSTEGERDLESGHRNFYTA